MVKAAQYLLSVLVLPVVSSSSSTLGCSSVSSGGASFCLPGDYIRQDRPNALSDEPMVVNTGFIIDDVSDVDDDSCAVTLVLIMRFSWIEDRLVKLDFGALESSKKLDLLDLECCP